MFSVWLLISQSLTIYYPVQSKYLYFMLPLFGRIKVTNCVTIITQLYYDLQLLSSCLWNLNFIIMSNITKVINLRRMIDQTGPRLSNNKCTYTSIFYHPSPFWPIIPFTTSHNLSYFWHTGLKLCTHLDQNCSDNVSKY